MRGSDAKKFKRLKEQNIQYVRQFIAMAKQNGDAEFVKYLEDKIAGF